VKQPPGDPMTLGNMRQAWHWSYINLDTAEIVTD
jgi:hypothetical protein